MVNIDKVDRQILKLLQQDSSRTIKELANQLKLTSTPVFAILLCPVFVVTVFASGAG